MNAIVRRSFARAAAFALAAMLAACGGAQPEEEGAPQEEPVASQASAVTAADCMRSLNRCNGRCDKLAQQGQDPSICYSDCSAQYYNCMCLVSPLTCFQN